MRESCVVDRKATVAHRSMKVIFSVAFVFFVVRRAFSDQIGENLQKGRVAKWPRCAQVILCIFFIAFTVISFPRYPDNPGILF